MQKTIQLEVCGAYHRREKGLADEIFVDHTRNGAYLRVDLRENSAREITQAEYEHSTEKRLVDGLPPPTYRDLGYDYDDDSDGLTDGPDDDD